MHQPAPSVSPSFRSRVPRVLARGLLAMVLVGAAGALWLLWRLGPDVEGTATRVEQEVRREFATRGATLQTLAAALAGAPGLETALDARTRDPRTLFDLVAQVTGGEDRDVAITVLSPEGTAIAWAGRPQPVPESRLTGGPTLFMAPGALGLRLVYVQPLWTRSAGSPDGRLIGAIAAERLLVRSEGVDAAAAFPARFETSLVPVTLRPRFLGTAAPEEGVPAVTILAPSGEALVDVTIARDQLAGLRSAWWWGLVALMAITLALTGLVLTGVLAWERRRQPAARYCRATLLAFVSLGAARWLLWWAWPRLQAAAGTWPAGVYEGDHLAWLHRTPVDLCATSFSLLACVFLAVDPIRRARLSLRRRQRPPTGAPATRVRFAATQLAAGVALAVLMGALARLVIDTVAHARIDVLMLALPPLEAGRLLVLLGLLGLSAAVFWGAVLILRVALVPWRLGGLGPVRRVVWPLVWWTLPLGAALTVLWSRGTTPPAGALLTMALAAGIACLATAQNLAWFRNGTQGRRLLAVYVTLLLPALLLYPLVLHAVDGAKRALVAGQYAPQVVSHPRELQARLSTSLAQLDAMEALPRVVASAPREVGRVPTDAAFKLWQQTDLARARLTSAVEVYAPEGPLVSRFGFNFPEYHASVPLWRSDTCTWEVFGEATVFGSEERSMLHAERAICETNAQERRRVRGGIILHVMLDYSSLPFLSTQSPYYDLFRAQERDPASREQIAARDMDLVVYGWGRSPIYSSSERVWALPQHVFERAYRSRAPFWATQVRGARVYDIYVANDRLSIYVIGFPRVTVVQHLVRLAEVATLAAMATALLLLVHAMLHYVNRRGPQPAALLVREVRASFTRKLFLAFVATSVIPVLTLAFVVRTFLASRLRADVEAEATRTASVAKRVIEEALALQEPALVSATALTDDVMVWISRVIKQDVNIFDGPTLLATSQRDLFAQGLLPERTPDTVYRAIALQRLPTFVGEDQIGGLQYQLAAAPIRVGTREAILTVPMTLRQREIEEEIADLDRSVNLGAIVFILLGSALGYSMAGRIGDPVQRLTRASRRIAAGDLDQRVVARTADELQRLVEAFNSMAEELSRQRAQLQRTNRLEAWAEMARQVAHDIKNPLTPIQLSAEHLRRVHRDRGEPLAPVLDACVDTILTQVRMLRQISSEFASFASSPSARPRRVALRALVDEVLAGYRIGLPSNVHVQSEVPADVPEVMADRALLGRAMINIIENALHAMPGGGTLTVRVTREDPGWVRVALSDTGVGMDAAALARLFEPYFSTKASGTGLGLSIAKRNVALMGGRIDVQSQEGVGTVVSLVLPAA